MVRRVRVHQRVPIGNGTSRNIVLLCRSGRSHKHTKNRDSKRIARQRIHSIQVEAQSNNFHGARSDHPLYSFQSQLAVSPRLSIPSVCVCISLVVDLSAFETTLFLVRPCQNCHQQGLILVAQRIVFLEHFSKFLFPDDFTVRGSCL